MWPFKSPYDRWQPWQKIAAPALIMAVDANIGYATWPFNSISSREVKGTSVSHLQVHVQFRGGSSVSVNVSMEDCFGADREALPTLIERRVREAANAAD